MTQRTWAVREPTPALENSNQFLTLGISSFLLFGLLTFGVLATEWIPRLDRWLLAFFTQFQEQAPAWLTAVSTWYQNGTSSGLGIAAALIILFFLFTGRHRRFWLMLASIGGTELLWWGLMFLIGRERPEQVIIWGGVNLPSYPSGHAMINVAFWGALSYIVYPYIPSKWGKRLLIGVVAVLLLLTGLNRLFFSVHYPTDVIGGYLIGIAWTAVSLWLIEYFLARRQATHEPDSQTR